MKKSILLVLLLLMASSVLAQSNELVVDSITLPEITWGEKIAQITIQNNAPYVKFVAVLTEVKIENNQRIPSRTIRSNHLLEPDQSITFDQNLLVPGAFGGGVIEFKFYDIVDTLDEILDYQLFETKKYDFKFTLPEKLLAYIEYPVNFPPRVNDNPYLNNDFTRIFLTMTAEGKTITDIARLTETDVKFITETADKLIDKRIIKEGNNIYYLNFPFIKQQEAVQTNAVAEEISNKLAAQIEANMTGYWSKVDSLVESKIIPRDSNDFLSGATLIYKPHAMVSTMLLWFELGQSFITRSAPLLIYDGTDICNADIYQYMYALNSDLKYYNEQFYYLSLGSNAYSITYSREKPALSCQDDYLLSRSQGKKARWRYEHPAYPEFFIVDTTTSRPILNLLKQSTESFLNEAYDSLKKINQQYGRSNVDFGYRYWFWSLVSEMTLQKLEKSGVIVCPENAFYRFDSIKRKI